MCQAVLRKGARCKGVYRFEAGAGAFLVYLVVRVRKGSNPCHNLQQEQRGGTSQRGGKVGLFSMGMKDNRSGKNLAKSENIGTHGSGSRRRWIVDHIHIHVVNNHLHTARTSRRSQLMQTSTVNWHPFGIFFILRGGKHKALLVK